MTKDQFLESYTYQPSKHKIGGGSFGTVYRAYDRINDREVAIKVQQVEHKNGKELSLKMEYEAIKALEAHPNVANYEKVYRYEESVGVMDYAIMQFYQSGNLSKYLKEGMPDIAQKEQILVQLLRGIAYLHLNNVVHRDIKPGNILVVERPDEGIIPKITDFGLSKRAEIDDNSTKFENSFAGGTIEYCSPEQLRGSELKFNTDLWSYGIIIFEVFTGRTVFNAKEFEAGSMGRMGKIAEMIMNKNISEEFKRLPSNWSKVARLCLDRDPEKRPNSGVELLEYLPKGLYDRDSDYFLKTPIKSNHFEEKTEVYEDSEYYFEEDDEGTVYDEASEEKEQNEEKKSSSNSPNLIKWVLAILVFIVMVAGIWFFAIKDETETKSLARVTLNGKVQYIDKIGNVKISTEFSEGSYFQDGRAPVKGANGWGYLDKKGEIVIPAENSFALPFSDGLGTVLKNGMWYFIDINGNRIFDQGFKDANLFVDGLAPVRIDNNWVFINKNGERAFDGEFENAFYYSDGLAPVMQDGKWGFIDSKGNSVIDFNYIATKDYTEDAVAVSEKMGSWYFVDKNENSLFDGVFEAAKNFSNGLAAVKKNGKWGFVDKKGVEVIDFKYDNLGRFSNGLAPVKVGEKWGFIDVQGQEVIKPKYNSVGEFY